MGVQLDGHGSERSAAALQCFVEVLAALPFTVFTKRILSTAVPVIKARPPPLLAS